MVGPALAAQGGVRRRGARAFTWRGPGGLETSGAYDQHKKPRAGLYLCITRKVYSKL